MSEREQHPARWEECYKSFSDCAECRKLVGMPDLPGDRVESFEAMPPHRGTGSSDEHPPVEGGYRGAIAEHDTGAALDAQNIPWVGYPHVDPIGLPGAPGATGPCAYPRSLTPAPSSVLGEAALAAASRVDAPKPTTRLPEDSAARKRIPLATGLLDYFPAALEDAINLLDSGETWDCDANAILQYLAERDYPTLLAACLDALQDELCGPPTQCRGRDVVKRWGAALIAVAEVSVYGNEKHNPGQPLHHARGKSMDHADCIARHTWDAGGFDGPMRHSACRAWRAAALGQEAAEADGAPLARGARLPEAGK